MLKDTPSINKPRYNMEVLAEDVKKEIAALKVYRSGWENDIREGWGQNNEAQEILYELYEISNSIIVALQDVLAGHYRGKMAMIMTKQKLEKLDKLATMSEAGMCHVITTGTRNHIRVMFQDLEILTK